MLHHTNLKRELRTIVTFSISALWLFCAAFCTVAFLHSVHTPEYLPVMVDISHCIDPFKSRFDFNTAMLIIEARTRRRWSATSHAPSPPELQRNLLVEQLIQRWHVQRLRIPHDRRAVQIPTEVIVLRAGLPMLSSRTAAGKSSCRHCVER